VAGARLRVRPLTAAADRLTLTLTATLTKAVRRPLRRPTPAKPITKPRARLPREGELRGAQSLEERYDGLLNLC
jgi:hypothetical protein